MAGRERRYELPGIEDLTKEQERVLALPREGRHLIVGGPGTGKTTVCLLRARRHARNRNDYVFLVWNHLLHRASRALFDGDLTAVTWKSWFWREFRRLVGTSVPTLGTDGGGWQPEDWSAVARLLDDLPRSENGTPGLPSLVIDEGQDMPPGFYDSLNSLGFEHIFVAADQNQQIKDENSSRRDLEELLVGQVVELTYNHRNSYPIARLARAFYTGDPASPPPDLPPAASTVYVPWLYRVDEAAMPRIARSILRHWDQDPRRLIGVIAPKNTVREKYLRELQHACEVVPLDNGRPVVETFYGPHRPDVRFDEGGVLVINALAAAILFGVRDGWLKLPVDLRGRPELREAVTHRMAALVHRLDKSGFDLGEAPPRVRPLRELFGDPAQWDVKTEKAAVRLARGLKWNCIRTTVSLGRGRYQFRIEGGSAHIDFEGEPKVVTRVDRGRFLEALAGEPIDSRFDQAVRRDLGG